MILLAMHMLMGDRTKYMGLLGAFFFTALMITQMTSLFVGIMSRTFSLITETSNTDIWVTDPEVETVGETAPMRSTALELVRGVHGVEYAMPMYVGGILVRLPGGRFVNAELIGLDTSTLIGAPRSGGFDWTALREAESVVVDTRSASVFLFDTFRRDGAGAVPRAAKPGDELLLNDHRVTIVGLAETGARMIAKPVIYTTLDRAVRWAPPQRNTTSFILVRAAKDTDAKELCRRISSQTGLRARTGRQLAEDTVRYTIAHTDIVKQVGFMVVLCSTIGVLVTSLLLNMFITDNLRHFASLKAMGLSDARLVVMIYAQTIWTALLGCASGIGGACALGTIMQRVNMPFVLLAPAAFAIPVLMILLSIIAASLSVRRVIRLEPAVVFKT